MLRAEADAIRSIAETHFDVIVSPIANIGSSTRRFRSVEQPFVDAVIFTPLADRGARFIHVDLKDDDGVDIVADINTTVGFDALQAQNPGAVFCFNLLEHVRDRENTCRHIERLLPPGGAALVSVPYSYPYHRDPIDTMFRPSPEEIAALFPNCALIHGEILACGSYRDKIVAKPRLVLSHILWTLTPFLGWRKWLQRAHRLSWIVRDYKVSIALLRKPLPTGPDAAQVSPLK